MKSVELFAGGGGLAIGLEKSGFHHSYIVENNKDACNTLKSNYLNSSDTVIHHGDIRQFDYNDISSNVKLVSGGPPCQPFSLGGNHKAFNDDRDLFPEAVKAIRELQPDVFIFENVKGLLRSAFADYFDYIVLQLQYPEFTRGNSGCWTEHLKQLKSYALTKPNAKLSYDVKFKLLNSANFGVPQKRERVFIVGFRKDLNVLWQFPSTSHSEDSLLWSQLVSKTYWQRHNIPVPRLSARQLKKADSLLKKYGMFEPDTLPWITVRDALSDLPEPTDLELSKAWFNHEYKEGARGYPGHTGSYIDEPSKTLKAGAHGVPGGENMIRFEDNSVRYFTVRESARIQTFPDSYVFQGAWGEAMRQLGNAVPVKLAQVIGRSVFEALNSNMNKAQ